MVHHLLPLLKLLWRERIALFWPVWFSITALGAVLAVWVVPVGKDIPKSAVAVRNNRSSQPGIVALLSLGLFLVFYCAGTLVWEDFTYYDNSHFTNGTLAGHDIPRQISPEGGRFWPLGHQEFNLLRHFTNSVAGYHAFRMVQLLLVCGVLLVFDEALTVSARVALIVLALITPSILISFTGLIYPEANVIFFFAFLVWFVKCFEETHSPLWAAAAVIASQFLLYYKELAFLLLFGLVTGRLLARCWREDRIGWDLKLLRDSESRLDLCLALMGVSFLVFYLAVMFPNYHTGYANEFRLPLARVLASFLQLDLLAWLFVAVFLARIVRIARHQIPPWPRWEGLALAGVAYFAGYLLLRMSSAYYLAPVDLIAILYLGRLAFLNLESMSFAVKASTFAALLLVCVQTLSLSAFRVYERKNVIHAKAELGQAIKARYDKDPADAKRLFFPYAEPFHILEFASYLNYIGVPVEQVTANAMLTQPVMLVADTIEKDGPCGYRAFVCHPGKAPEPGDLVVVLPDDFPRADRLTSFQQQGDDSIFSYRPLPSLPEWLRPYVSSLRIVSPVFANRPIPQSWLNASLTVQH
jgi:hypothetical protein